MTSRYYHPDTDFIRKLGAAPPVAIPHLTEEELAENMKQFKPNEWRLEGNKLIGETEIGTLVQFIPTDVVLTGTDENGLPTFRKVVV